MGLSKTALWYRKATPEQRKKHNETSKKWNKSESGKKYKKEKNAEEHEKNKRSRRNKARRILGLKKGDPRVADHKKPLAKGGSNKRSNLRAVSASINNRRNKK